ncbi:MAG: bifunctional phosphopantothenoylcysteine decarboxylase/phosphopantothenate--cysteine ligase CoaBC [Chitinophagaceae bacterium]|nr:bifunctional phosphopantothenoylcysteine decarboxylase/phosphopantothenate--cysteine ligase CoaBC [Chitinophagaceae bacterium]
MLKGKKIVLGITGSIAAYKSIFLLRLLVKEGAQVKVILTPAARDFVSPLTLSTLSKEPVLTELFDEQSWANHVMLGRWADLMLIAPASCNTISKMAHGACDNLLLATYLSATCPVWLAPAMDEDMWHHPATKENLQKLRSFGNRILPVDQGELASGLYGDGRMAEPQLILELIRAYFANNQVLKGKRVLITAGPTYEALDPVRFIGNHSSGKMGIAIAREIAERGGEVTLVLGPSSVKFNENGIEVIRVTSAQEMYNACLERFAATEIAILSAAVADYTPIAKAEQKMKKEGEGLQVELKRTPDILKSLGERKHNGQVLVGFALETENEIENARGKLQRKNADMIVLNSLNDAGAGFGHDTNKITIIYRDGAIKGFDTRSKDDVAKDIVDALIEKHYA